MLCPGNLSLMIVSPRGNVQRIELGERDLIIGRSGASDVSLRDERVSSFHCRISRRNGSVMIRDLESRNGTWLNDHRVEEGTLNAGDTLRIGSHLIMLGRDGDASAPEDDVSITANMSIELERLQGTNPSTVGISDDTRLSLLWRSGEHMNRMQSPEEVIAATQTLVGQCFSSSRVFVVPVPLADAESWQRGPSRSVVEQSLSTRSAVLAQQVASDERFKGKESIISSGVETVMAVPLLCGREASAVVYVDGKRRQPFSANDLRLLGIIANQAAAALESASLVATLRRTNRQLESANEENLRLQEDLERRVEERTEQVRRQTEEIRSLASEKDELLGMVAHDIRGPLTLVVSVLEFCTESVRTGDHASLLEDLGEIREAAWTMARLLSDLLDVKKIEAGRIELNRAEFDVASFCRHAAALGVLHGRKAGIEVNFEIEPGLLAFGDAPRLEQVLGNLLVNALKFTQRGGSVTLRARRAERAVEFAVCDSGPGIAANEIDKLFDPWTQGEEGKRRSGTGLGLAIARKIVEMHGGAIRVESAPGIGSRFTFTVPTMPEAAEPR